MICRSEATELSVRENRRSQRIVLNRHLDNIKLFVFRKMKKMALVSGGPDPAPFCLTILVSRHF
ncbi:hypothetical protein Mapa_007801 [Marchantia paleacea]|nr:hypothetical protein Mapa_007801 [Marchantia paleacea]